MSEFPPVIDDLDIGLVVHDPETAAIVHANDHAVDLYGYSVEELRTMPVETFSADDYTQAEAKRQVQAAAAGDPQLFEWRVQRDSGELLWIEVRLTRTTFDETPYVLAQVQDITEYKIRERRLRLLNRITRHNLRNKVTVIHGYAASLLDGPLPSGADDQLQAIHDAATELLELTDTINALKSVTDKETSRREPIELAGLVSAVVDEYRTEYPAVDWTVTCDCDCWVAADDGLRLAVKEAIENTVEHNDHDQLRVAVTVTEAPTTGQAVVRMEDTGQPIPEMEITTTEDGVVGDQTRHGEGAGFWVMESILESLGGRLQAENLDGGGSAVEFRLPQAPPPSDGIATALT